MLVLISLLAITSFAGMLTIDDAIRRGVASNDWIGMRGLGLTSAAICGALVAFFYATRNDRSGAAWALGSFFFPYVTPLILAALPESGGVTTRAGVSSSNLQAVLAGKWICSCGVIHANAHDGDVCGDCGKSMIRFFPGEAGQSCGNCGFRFSDVAVTIEDTMQAVWARKGFRCDRCGRNLCMSCMPAATDGDPSFRCRCGGPVAIRV